MWVRGLDGEEWKIRVHTRGAMIHRRGERSRRKEAQRRGMLVGRSMETLVFVFLANAVRMNNPFSLC